jgi:Glycosyltransferase family 87
VPKPRKARLKAWSFCATEMSAWPTRSLIILSLLLSAAGAAVWVADAFFVALNSSQDNEWGPARALLQGLDPYRLYLSCLHCRHPPFTASVAPSYPASGLMLLWPLAMLPWPVAKVAWASLNLVFGASLTFTLWRLFDPKHDWLTLAVASIALYAGTPFLNNLGNGQHAVFALAWFAFALWAERRGNMALASAFLAASWFKYTLTLPLSLFFIVRGRWALLLGAIAIHVILTAFLAVWTGTSPLDLLLGPLRVAPVGIEVGHLDVFGLATRMDLQSKLGSWVAAFALTAIIVAVAVRSRMNDDLALLSLLSLYAYTVVYHLAYDLVILAFPLFYLLNRMRSWRILSPLERLWATMLAVLLAWTFFVDHQVQAMRMRDTLWGTRLDPIYFTATALWFYVTLAVGIAFLGGSDCRAECVHRRPEQ